MGASHIETLLTAEANRRLATEGVPWASVRANGRTLILAGQAPAARDIAHAMSVVYGQDAASGVAAIDTSAVTILPPPLAVEAYKFGARLEGGKLALTGMAPAPDALDRLLEPFALRSSLQIDSDITFKRIEGERSWIDAATTAMAALALLESGALQQFGFQFRLSGNAGSSEAADAVESLIAGGQGNYRYEISIDRAPTPHSSIEFAKACQTAINRAMNGRMLTFGPASANLSRSDRTLLRELAGAIVECEGMAVMIEGHTDSTGDQAANLRLAERRAAAVRTYLKRIGAPGDFVIRAYGEARPIASNRTATGQQRNRRIDLVVDVNRVESE